MSEEADPWVGLFRYVQGSRPCACRQALTRASHHDARLRVYLVGDVFLEPALNNNTEILQIICHVRPGMKLFRKICQLAIFALCKAITTRKRHYQFRALVCIDEQGCATVALLEQHIFYRLDALVDIIRWCREGLEAGIFQYIEGSFLVATVLSPTGGVAYYVYRMLNEAVLLQRGDERLLDMELEADIFSHEFLENETAALIIDLANEGARVTPKVL